MGNKTVTFKNRTEQWQNIDQIDQDRLFGELYIEDVFDSFRNS